jgi:hypothetical protein
LVYDIPAGDGKIANLFYSVNVHLKHLSMFYHPCSESPTQNSQYSNSQTYASQNILPGIIGTRTEIYLPYNYQKPYISDYIDCRIMIEKSDLLAIKERYTVKKRFAILRCRMTFIFNM